jgi:hypothetical protein
VLLELIDKFSGFHHQRLSGKLAPVRVISDLVCGSLMAVTDKHRKTRTLRGSLSSWMRTKEVRGYFVYVMSLIPANNSWTDVTLGPVQIQLSA